MAHDVLSNMETIYMCAFHQYRKFPLTRAKMKVKSRVERTINIGQCVFPSGSLDKIRRCRSQRNFFFVCLLTLESRRSLRKYHAILCESTHVGCGNELGS